MMRRIFLLVFLLQLLLPAMVTISIPSDICQSIEIRTVKEFDLLRKCRIVVGHVHILFVLNPPPESFSSAVEEITDHLVVHRAHGLETLQHLFPRLVLIRGRELLFDKYALVIYENRNLLDLGLISLLRIQSGDIRIEKNSVLCFVHTINWIYLMGNSTQQHFHLKNLNPNHCPYCDKNRAKDAIEDNIVDLDHPKMPSSNVTIEEGVTVPINQSCWKFGVYQRKVNSFSCLKACGIAGCNANGTCCNRNCLSGCSASNCSMCANLRQGQKCVDHCILPHYEFNKRECITEGYCHQIGMLPHAGTCVERCPEHHEHSKNAHGQFFCKPMCRGLFVVHTSQDLNALKACESINGSLIIELHEMKTRIVEELSIALGNIREITGYLKVVRSPQLVSLNFLSHLDTIRGDELIDGKHALYVVDNHHFEHIWTNNQKVAISKGHIYFHLNPRLCHDKILKLQDSLMNAGKITEAEASPNSNGERVICGSNIRVLEAIVEDINATAVRIKVNHWSAEDRNLLTGYVHRYMEAPLKNVTMYDGQHGCGHDNWHMDLSASVNVRHIITNLKPNTQYAFFVKSTTLTEYHWLVDGYSPIQYFTTLQSKPGLVEKIYSHSESPTVITFHWWPPRIPNGVIKKYIFSLEQVAIVDNEMPNRNEKNVPTTKSDDTCECHVKSADASGPLPKAQNYHDQFQLVFEEALPNIIYVRQKPRNVSSSQSTTTTESSFISLIESTTARMSTRSVSDSESRRQKPKNVSSSQSTTTTESSFISLIESTTARMSTRSVSDSESSSSSTAMVSKSVDITSTTSTTLADGDIKLNMLFKQMDERARLEQDTGTKDFPILKPLPVCPFARVSVQYQLENSCVALEHYNGIEVDGHVHAYTFDELEPGISYTFTIRACVEGLENGCGIGKGSVAKTPNTGGLEFVASSCANADADV